MHLFSARHLSAALQHLNVEKRNICNKTEIKTNDPGSGTCVTTLVTALTVLILRTHSWNRSIGLSLSALKNTSTHEYSGVIFHAAEAGHTDHVFPLSAPTNSSRKSGEVTDDAVSLRKHPAIKVVCLSVSVTSTHARTHTYYPFPGLSRCWVAAPS